MSRVARSAAVLLLFAALFWIGTLIHEGGHMLIALLHGVRIVHLQVLGLDLIPRLAFDPLPGYFGYVRYQGTLTEHQRLVFSLWGSLATFLVALAAQAVWWIARPPRGLLRAGLLFLCFFWVDVVYHSPLPGAASPARSFEPYRAATGLGLSPGLYAAIVWGLSALLLILTLLRWYLLRRRDTLMETTPEGIPN